jgi:hypothetical protein
MLTKTTDTAADRRRKVSTAMDLLLFKVKKEVKFILENTVKSHRGSRGIAPLFF